VSLRSDPDKPVGTLIFTAADHGNGDVRWNAVSIDGESRHCEATD